MSISPIGTAAEIVGNIMQYIANATGIDLTKDAKQHNSRFIITLFNILSPIIVWVFHFRIPYGSNHIGR